MCTATRKPNHTEPIYLVSFDGKTLVTNTRSARDGQTAADGFPVQYRQTIEVASGRCTCDCQGFQQSISWKAQRAGELPTLANGRTCKHCRKAAEWGRERGYLGSESVPVEVEAPQEPKAPDFDYVSFFEKW